MIWYDPIEIARPRVFARVFLVLLGLDCWLLMVPRGALYGSSGFNVSHFAWLDRIQPMPTAGWYIATLASCGFFALVAGFSLARWAVAATLILYTYGWSMSLLDAYQHHYLISLILVCVLFFPLSKSPVRQPAWSFKLLGATIAIVYAYTAICKMESGWLGGQTCRAYLGPDPLVDWLAALLGSPPGSLAPYQVIAISVVAAEWLLAAGYLIAIAARDDSTAWTRMPRLLTLVVALLVHSMIERLDFEIGWFSAYMILAALVFLLPDSVWAHLRQVGERFGPRGNFQPSRNRQLATASCAAVAAGPLAVLIGKFASLPGLASFGWIAAVATCGSVGLAWTAGQPATARNWGLACFASVLALLVCLAPGSMQSEFHALAGQDLYARNHYEQAIPHFQRALAQAGSSDPVRRAELHEALGQALVQREQVEAGIEHLEQSIQLAPGRSRAHYHLGNAWRTTGQPNRAEQHLRKAIELRNDFAAAHFNLASLLAQAGSYDTALSHTREALRHDPTLAAAHHQLAKLHLLRGEVDAAEASYRRAIDGQPHDPDAFLLLATLYLQQGRFAESLRVLDQLDQHIPGLARSRLLRGLVYDTRGDLAAAEREYRQALQIEPRSADAMYNLGTIRAREERFQEAVDWFRKALAADPTYQSAREALEQLRSIQP